MRRFYPKSILLLGIGLFLLSSCTGGDSVYSESKKKTMEKASDLVVEAKYARHNIAPRMGKIDAAEGREGFETDIQYGVTFEITKSIKDKFERSRITVGINMPGFAFGITPGEYPGKKKYILYFKKESQSRTADYSLIGAEWVNTKIK